MGNSHSHSRADQPRYHISAPLPPPRSLKHHKSTPAFLPLRCPHPDTATATATASDYSYSLSESSRTSASFTSDEKPDRGRQPHALPAPRPRARSASRARSSRRGHSEHGHHCAHAPPPPLPYSEHACSEHDYAHIPALPLPSPAAGLLPAPPAEDAAATAYADFLRTYPAYAHTWALDALRRAEFARLGPSATPGAAYIPEEEAHVQTYVDYMGGALYPESLVSVHMEFLRGAVLGNTHSESPSSQLSTRLARTARDTVLRFFNAPPGSAVIFTPNASGALKLFGESFPFAPGSTYVLPEDAHNSVHGIREFCARAGGAVVYVPGTPRGGVDVRITKSLLAKHRSSPAGPPSLFALTGLSNITNAKPPLALLRTAKERGFVTLLDAAALAPTAVLDLSRTPADAVAVSFYKMFGFPTGIGALILGPDVVLAESAAPTPVSNQPPLCRAPGMRFLGHGAREKDAERDGGRDKGADRDGGRDKGTERGAAQDKENVEPGRAEKGKGRVGLRRVWFAGGTVDVVQVPGTHVTRAQGIEEQFEDGTINYLLLPAVTTGLRFLSAYIPLLPARLGALTAWLCNALDGLRHPGGARVCAVLSAVPRAPGEFAEMFPGEEEEMGAGGTVACLFYDPHGTLIPLSRIAARAAAAHVALRTGCVCNPGGAAQLLRLQAHMAGLRAGDTLAALEARAGRELGVVRVSLGLGSDWGDCWRVVEWVRAEVVGRELDGREEMGGREERTGGGSDGIGRAV